MFALKDHLLQSPQWFCLKVGCCVAGRAVVQLVVERPDTSLAFVNDAGGGPSAQARIAITLDGYSAPVTAGNFAMNVINGNCWVMHD